MGSAAVGNLQKTAGGRRAVLAAKVHFPAMIRSNRFACSGSGRSLASIETQPWYPTDSSCPPHRRPIDAPVANLGPNRPRGRWG